MKIRGRDGSSKLQCLPQRIQSSGGTAADHRFQSHTESHEEKVKIFPQAKALESHRRVSEWIPAARRERIEEIRQRIQTGQYRVDLEAVSDRILEALILRKHSWLIGTVPQAQLVWDAKDTSM